ncbi:hypothetical protein GF361_04850 [Candidatus Woesearchaeota archaeon]|nr:hypothetical protein [Candidatus Woesearchaeota archaeon]
MPNDSGMQESGGGVLDRIHDNLIQEDIDSLVELHHTLSREGGYQLANKLKHLVCHIYGINNKKSPIYVETEINLETTLGSRILHPLKEHETYDPRSAGYDEQKQARDIELFNRRKGFLRHLEEKGLVEGNYPRDDILKFEVYLRNEDINLHKYYLTEQMIKEESFDYLNGSGAFLTVVAGHWDMEQSVFFYKRAEEHYYDMGIPFEWKANLEMGIVVETLGQDKKFISISGPDKVRLEGNNAQRTMFEELEKIGKADMAPEYSINYYRPEESKIIEDKNHPTGIFTLNGKEKEILS